MDFRKSRVTRLETRQRRAHRLGNEHYTPVFHVPAHIPAHQWEAWLRAQRCACGVVACDKRTIGLLLPTRAQTAEEWEARYGREGES